MTITEFLNARLDEDEAAARAARPWWPSTYTLKFAKEDRAVHIARHDPDRVLAEVEAKRRVIEMTPVVRGLQDPTAEAQHMLVLAHLASVYAGHPAYDPDWAWQP